MEGNEVNDGKDSIKINNGKDSHVTLYLSYVFAQKKQKKKKKKNRQVLLLGKWHPEDLLSSPFVHWPEP